MSGGRGTIDPAAGVGLPPGANTPLPNNTTASGAQNSTQATATQAQDPFNELDPIDTIFSKQPKQRELANALQKYKITNKKIFLRKGAKESGAGKSKADSAGGVYNFKYKVGQGANAEIKKGTILFKQDVKGNKVRHDKIICEFVGAKLMNAITGDKEEKENSAADIFLTTPDNNPDGTGNDVFIGSVFYENNYKAAYQDLYRKHNKLIDLHNATYPDNQLKHLKIPTSRPKGVGIRILREEPTNVMMLMHKKSTNECAYENFGPAFIPALLAGDFDVHWENIGVVGEDGTAKQMVKIDHGAALYHLDDSIHMHSHWQHAKVGIEPTNHFREWPRRLRISREFAQHLNNMTSPETLERVKDAINSSMDEVKKFYTNESSNVYNIKAIMEFANRIGVSNDDINNIDQYYDSNKTKVEEIIKFIKKYLSTKMEKRFESGKELAKEINLSIALVKQTDNEFGFAKIDEDKDFIDQQIKEDPKYFFMGTFHFRHKDQRHGIGLFKTHYFANRTLTKMVNKKIDQIIYQIPNAKNILREIIEENPGNKELIKRCETRLNMLILHRPKVFTKAQLSAEEKTDNNQTNNTKPINRLHNLEGVVVDNNYKATDLAEALKSASRLSAAELKRFNTQPDQILIAKSKVIPTKYYQFRPQSQNKTSKVLDFTYDKTSANKFNEARCEKLANELIETFLAPFEGKHPKSIEIEGEIPKLVYEKMEEKCKDLGIKLAKSNQFNYTDLKKRPTRAATTR